MVARPSRRGQILAALIACLMVSPAIGQISVGEREVMADESFDAAFDCVMRNALRLARRAPDTASDVASAAIDRCRRQIDEAAQYRANYERASGKSRLTQLQVAAIMRRSMAKSAAGQIVEMRAQ